MTQTPKRRHLVANAVLLRDDRECRKYDGADDRCDGTNIASEYDLQHHVEPERFLDSPCLRHATRTRLLLHLVDGGTEDPARDIADVNYELHEYGAGLEDKPQLIVINKTDIPEVASREQEVRQSLEVFNRPIYVVSAAAGTGVRELMLIVAHQVESMRKEETAPQASAAPAPRVQRTRMRRRYPTVVKEGDVFVVEDAAAERLVAGSDIRGWVGRVQIKAQLTKMGVTKSLENAGVKLGDTVRFGEIELEW